ncbi:MAG: secretin and TonB N-terminal domain-containing protein [Candidatus Omnitrophica bacterium]|nr:secretin and TonB N-terminal domain-containing protein [Candidatus Omnitrophota bacterium]
MESEKLISRKRAVVCLFLMSLSGWFFINAALPLAFAQQSFAELAYPKTEKAESDDKLISITLKETDIREVLNILAFKGGVNIVAGDDVVAKISVQLKEVPWEQALDVILKTYNFTYKREGNLIRVMSLARAQEEEGKTPLKTKILALNFADVEELKESLNKMLSKRGTMEVDKRTNSLIITDIPEMVDAIEESAIQLDTLTPQVLIEAMMVDIKITDKNQWGTLLNVIDLKNSPNSLDTALSDGAGTGLLNFGTITDNFDITGTIVSLVSQGMASILANPKVLTLDNQKAMIEIITEIPYTESVDSGGAVTTTIKFKDAGIKLSVTPHITSGRFISMNVLPEQSFQSGFAEGTSQPIIDKRSAETNLLVKDGQTIVIGGLRQSTDNLDQGKIPYLGDIPFFGLFFRNKLRTKVETELVIFVTPHIIETALLNDREIELFEKLDNTARLAVDERSEMEKFRAFMNITKEVNKAEKIAEHESKRMRLDKEVSIESADKQVLYNRQKVMPKDSVVVAPDVSSAAYQQNKALELEADKFRESMDSLKREY